MKLTKEQEELLVAGIQAGLGILIIGLSVKNSAAVQSRAMKKVMQKDAKRVGKLHKIEYRQKKKLMQSKYRDKLRKNRLRQQRWYGRIKR